MNNLNGTDPRVINSVQRALDILDLFNFSTSELGITEIATALSLHKSTVSGLVYTLEINDYLEQNPENRKYRLGLKLIERAHAVFGRLEIRQVALPYLEELRDWSGESVNLAIRDHNQVVYIERMVSEQQLGIRAEIGKRAWVHCTALGKAILSHMPENVAQQILESYSLEALTPHTITTVNKVMEDLHISRERGYAIDDEENELGGRCVSAPIFNYQGDPIAAVSISVPLPRIPPNRIAYFGTKVKSVASEISSKLGYRLTGEKAP